MKVLGVYLYNDAFYNNAFIGKVKEILESCPQSFAQFECYSKKINQTKTQFQTGGFPPLSFRR